MTKTVTAGLLSLATLIAPAAALGQDFEDYGDDEGEVEKPKKRAVREIVKGMTNDDLIAAAAFVASQPRPPVPSAAAEPARMEKGAALSAKHRCGQCHGAQFLGGAQMPPLRHQREDYLLKAMQDFKAERRLGDRAAMVEVVTPLGAKDLADLAYFLARVRN